MRRRALHDERHQQRNDADRRKDAGEHPADHRQLSPQPGQACANPLLGKRDLGVEAPLARPERVDVVDAGAVAAEEEPLPIAGPGWIAVDGAIGGDVADPEGSAVESRTSARAAASPCQSR